MVNRAQLLDTHAQLVKTTGECNQFFTNYRNRVEDRLETNKTNYLGYSSNQQCADVAAVASNIFFVVISALGVVSSDQIQILSTLSSRGVDIYKNSQESDKAVGNFERDELTRLLNQQMESQKLRADLLKQIHDAAMSNLSTHHQSMIKTTN